MSLLNVSIVNVALPSIRIGLDASEAELQWIISGYALSFGLVLVAAGRLGDARGRRSMFVLGVVLFAGSSVLGGFAPIATWLVFARSEENPSELQSRGNTVCGLLLEKKKRGQASQS